jgi:hypothetical protein
MTPYIQEALARERQNTMLAEAETVRRPGKHYRIGAGPPCRPSADHRFAGPKTCCRRRGAACSPGSEDLDLRQPGAGPRRTTVQRWPNERSAALIPLRQPRNARHRAPPFRWVPGEPDMARFMDVQRIRRRNGQPGP